jgi:hypothetical protein
MALITFKDCQKEFSTDAKKCPHCGAKKPSKKFDSSMKSVLGFFVILFLVSKILIPESSVPPAPPPSAADIEEADAAVRCRAAVDQSLHDPDSAKFDPSPMYFRQKEKDGAYNVQVTLQARNGFNALRKMVVKCRVKKSSEGNWTILELKELR